MCVCVRASVQQHFLLGENEMGEGARQAAVEEDGPLPSLIRGHQSHGHKCVCMEAERMEEEGSSVAPPFLGFILWLFLSPLIASSKST